MRNQAKRYHKHGAQRIIIYDGICLLCSKTIIFINKQDKKKKFDYLSYHSEAAKKLLITYNLDFSSQQFIVYLNNSRCYSRSRAVLEILKDLGGFWSLLYIFIIVPPFLRNYIYNYIAKNRDRWFN